MKYLSVYMLLLISFGSVAQQNSTAPVKPDHIVLKTGGIIEAEIVTFDERKITYIKLTDLKDRYTSSIEISRVDKLVYGKTGKEVTFNRQALPAAETTTAISGPESQIKPVQLREKIPSRLRYGMISTTIGGEFNYYPGFVNKQWTSNSAGYALDFSYGPNLRVDFRPIPRAALSLGAGYNHFVVDRNFRSEETPDLILYSEKQTLTQIPVTGGIKIYLKKHFYVVPEFGVTVLSSKISTNESHPAPDFLRTLKSKPNTYGAGIGTEVHTYSGLVFDFSLKFVYQDMERVYIGELGQTLNQPLTFTCLRVGIGFDALRR